MQRAARAEDERAAGVLLETGGFNRESPDTELDMGGVHKEELGVDPEVLQPPDVHYLQLEPKAEPNTDWQNDEEMLDMSGFIKEELDVGPVVLQPPDLFYMMQPEPKLETDSGDWRRDGESAETVAPEREEPGVGPADPEPELEADTAEWQLSREPTVVLQRLLLCDDCNGFFTRRSELVRHITTAHCSNMRRHKEDVQSATNRETRILCSYNELHVCMKQLEGKFCKERNDLTHTNEGTATPSSLKYIKCKTISNSANQLKNTYKRVRRYKCNECDKLFTDMGHLRRHMFVHTGIKPHKCNKCDKSYTQSGDLKIHERIHNGVKPYKCTKCDKSFSQSGHLKSHMNIHTAVKPFKCTECNKCFSRSSDLKIHGRIHNGIKPYKCTNCDMSFSRSSVLKYHVATHTGVMPYKCTECDKAFSRSDTLKAHTRIHSGVNPFKCTDCHKIFSRRDNLKTHMRIHTGAKPYKYTGALKTHTKL